MAVLQHGIGEGVSGGIYSEGNLPHALLHGAVGCAAAEVLDGNCASGAAAGIAQSVFVGLQEGAPEQRPGQSDEEYYALYNAWKNDVAGQAKLLGAVVGYTTSGGLAVNVTNAGSIAESGSRNNYLNHTELQEARELFDKREELENKISELTNNCIICNVQEVAEIRAELARIQIEINALQIQSAANTLAMVEACAAGNTVECQRHRAEAADYLDNTGGWFGMGSRPAAVFDVSADALNGVEVDWGGNLDEWLTEQYDIAEVTPDADWGAIESVVADYAIMRDGIINVGVGTAAIGVATIGCIGSSGLACGVIVGGAALAESNTIYDGVATVITGESQDGYIKNSLLAAGFEDADATEYEQWIEAGLAVATISVDGVLVLRNMDGAILATGRQTVDELTGAGAPSDGVRGDGVVPDSANGFMDGATETGATVRHGEDSTVIGGDPRTLNNFDNATDTGRGHNVIVHGELDYDELGGIPTVDDQPTNIAQIADAVRSNPNYVEGSQICFASCWSGSSGTAQQLADDLGVPVMAPSRPVAFDPQTGDFVLQPNIPYLENGNVVIPSNPQIEPTWQIFLPNGE